MLRYDIRYVTQKNANLLVVVMLVVGSRLFALLLPAGPPLLGVLDRLGLYLLLDSLSLPLALRGQRLFLVLELGTLDIGPNQPLEQLDLVGPHLPVLDRLAVRALLVDGRLEHHGQVLEPIVVDDIVKRAQAQEARPNVGMQVPVRAKRRLAVVEVQRLEVPEPHHPVKLGHGGGKGVGRAEIVARGKGVARVEAHADAVLVRDALDDVAQVLEAPANDVAVAAHVFEDGDDGVGGLVGLVELGGDAARGGGHGGAAGGARVEVVELDAQAVAAREVVDKVGVGLLGLGRVGLGEVDEVGAVREDVAAGRVGVVLGEGVEGVAGGRVEGRGGPFALGLEEEGEGVAANVDGVGDGILDTCGYS